MEDKKRESSLFLLKSHLKKSDGETETIMIFEKVLRVYELRQIGKNATIYDKELKLHFTDRSALSTIYEISIEDVHIQASRDLSKAEGFIRMTNYMYDWMQVKVNNSTGKVLSIENKQELRETWQRLKTKIKQNYHGKVVENELRKLDAKIEQEEVIWSVINQYIHWGILFPHIPSEHHNNWERKRTIELSEYERERFKETTVYSETLNNNRKYKLDIQTLSESSNFILKCDGLLSVPVDDLLPSFAEIQVVFGRKNLTNEWGFELLRYN